MGWGAPADKPANVTTGPIGDAGNAQPLKLMRGINFNPHYHCYIFNISAFSQDVPKGSRSYQLRGIRADSPFVMVRGKKVQYEIGAVIPSVVIDTYIDSEAKRRMETQDGEEVARDVLNPAIGPTSDNNDLTKWGCGYFKRNIGEPAIPTEEEVGMIVQQYDDNMRMWLKDGDQLEAGGKSADINAIHIRASNHFRAARPWNKNIGHPEECPNCGTEVQPGSRFHILPGTNIMCIIGVEGWKVAVKSGIKTRAEVPEEMRWWSEQPASDAEPKAADEKEKAPAARKTRAS